MASGSGGSQSAQRRKLYQRCKEIGLTRDERLHLAEYLLRRDISSFDQLDELQVCRLLDAIEGKELIDELEAQRPPGS